MGPGQTTPGKSNSTTTLSIGNERASERETQRKRGREKERETEKEKRVCILLKRLSCQVNTSQKWETEDSEFLSLQRLRMKGGGKGRKSRRGNEGWVLAFALLPSLFLSCVSAAYHTNMLKQKKRPVQALWPAHLRETCKSHSHIKSFYFLIIYSFVNINYNTILFSHILMFSLFKQYTVHYMTLLR